MYFPLTAPIIVSRLPRSGLILPKAADLPTDLPTRSRLRFLRTYNLFFLFIFLRPLCLRSLCAARLFVFSSLLSHTACRRRQRLKRSAGFVALVSLTAPIAPSTPGRLFSRPFRRHSFCPVLHANCCNTTPLNSSFYYWILLSPCSGLAPTFLAIFSIFLLFFYFPVYLSPISHVACCAACHPDVPINLPARPKPSSTHWRCTKPVGASFPPVTPLFFSPQPSRPSSLSPTAPSLESTLATCYLPRSGSARQKQARSPRLHLPFERSSSPSLPSPQPDLNAAAFHSESILNRESRTPLSRAQLHYF